ncbi:hypothetical protein EDEG_00806 [Edhazardia aedis USNM 41457]|uniref:UBC core domain-containing protein n=1 Tax=Edhazardia aedis (strain USNM 41457) TaxID=1003232 RepID=J8ZZN9_EDHAE|nr:hypothetical protein EDEG_00806 [Edhazardia aedis USNM 41457]|eukprot:EJW05093.1 hypothetical protein EDEG_00806 [Edhazardia aedis USNM 41457]
MNTAIERLNAERKKIRKDRKYLFFANPTKKGKSIDLLNWRCSFPGPNLDLYKDSYYFVRLHFKKEYPFKPPQVVFEKKVFHPNVYTDGSVCLDIISSAWKPTMNIMQILVALQSLLAKPNILSPANRLATEALKSSELEYELKVREDIKKNHSMPDWSKFKPF